ncbi:phosphatidylinositol 4-phosphate 3-kinase C2 domain-containing subunit alpha-like, partial [Engystomops pustulosus]|uniref:phosphatidylinositol 4-phosphate 3-kinase C2 domain-containing subunit alpha-like n=1 Tax=Engystomops pustulosus TaxID=76066 RepID=UPI003AFA9567
MAQTSSSNGLRQNGRKDVGKEEAIQMEAEALDKLRREKRLLGSAGSAPPGSGVQDLMVFPESDPQLRAQNSLYNVDVEKLPLAELEKLLLDDTFVGVPTPRVLPQTQVLCPPVSSQSFRTPTFQCSQWTPVPLPQPAFQPPGRALQFLSLPAAAPYASFSMSGRAPFPMRGALPPYPGGVTPDMAKLLDKIARTSELLRNGKSNHETRSPQSPMPGSPQEGADQAQDMSKFDWLDLDPLSKPKAEAVELSGGAEAAAMGSEAGDPWDAVLLEEKPVTSTYTERKVGGRSPSGATVTRSHSLNLRPAHGQLSRSQSTEMDAGSARTPSVRSALQDLEVQDEEVAAFCKEVERVRRLFPSDHFLTNPGFVLSPVMAPRMLSSENCSAKVSIEIEGFQQPVTFTCDVSSPVELIIMQALCWVHDDLSRVDIESHILKVCGQEEVLQNKHSLGSHEYIQMCRKWDVEIRLQLLCHRTVCRALARTAEDDETPVELHRHLALLDRPFKEPITRQNIEELLDAFYEQVSTCLKNESNPYRTADQVIKVVRSICRTADSVEIPDITESVKKLRRAVNLPRSRSVEGPSSPPAGHQPLPPDGSPGQDSPLQESLSQLTTAVHKLLQLHLTSCIPAADPSRPLKEARSAADHLHFTIFAVHGVPTGWVSSFEKYYMVSSLLYNGRDLFTPVQSKKVGTYKSFFYLVKWDELIIFPIAMAQLPLETVLQLRLYGILNPNSGGSPDSNKQRKGPEMLGQASVPLFNFKRTLTSGSRLLTLWTSFFSTTTAGASLGRRTPQMQKLVLQVDFPSSAFDIVYKAPEATGNITPLSMETLDKEARTRLLSLITRHSPSGISKEDKAFVWEKRHYCHSHKNCLPTILSCAPKWEVAYLGDIYALIRSWPPLTPVCALELLNSRFADQVVRAAAVDWIQDGMSDDELVDLLPQFVQVSSAVS